MGNKSKNTPDSGFTLARYNPLNFAKNWSLTLREKIKRFRKKKIWVNKGSNFIYKVAVGDSFSLMKNEFSADAQFKNTIWQNLGAVFYRPVFKTSCFCVAKSPRVNAGNLTDDDVHSITDLLLSAVKPNSRFADWKSTLDSASLEIVWNILDPEEKQFLLQKMEGMRLPQTTAHGDLIPQNIFRKNRDNWCAIDWEYFRTNGSVITDILRFHVYYFLATSKFERRSFNIVANLQEEFFLNLSEKLGYRADELAVLYSFSNTCMPVTQRKPDVRAKIFQKYLRDFMDYKSEVSQKLRGA